MSLCWCWRTFEWIEQRFQTIGFLDERQIWCRQIARIVDWCECTANVQCRHLKFIIFRHFAWRHENEFWPWRHIFVFTHFATQESRFDENKKILKKRTKINSDGENFVQRTRWMLACSCVESNNQTVFVACLALFVGANIYLSHTHQQKIYCSFALVLQCNGHHHHSSGDCTNTKVNIGCLDE